MNADMAPRVSVIVLAWNSTPHIDDCLRSILAQTYAHFEVLVIDSASGDGTADHVKARYPQVELLPLSTNEGYRRGNAVGMERCDGKYVVVVNDDVEVEPTWLAEMIAVMEGDPSVGLATPMILQANDPGTVNAAGNDLHFSGLYWARGKGKPRSCFEVDEDIPAVSGCCFVIRRDLLTALDGFSSDFDRLDVGWHASFEDVDLGWRALMAGYRIRYVAKSVLYHKYKQPAMFAARFAAHEWGRYLFVLRNLGLPTLLALVPFLCLLELGAWGFAMSKGRPYLKAKARVTSWLVLHGREILTMRRRVQAVRRVSDAAILPRLASAPQFGRQLGTSWIAHVATLAIRWTSRVYLAGLVAVSKIARRPEGLR